MLDLWLADIDRPVPDDLLSDDEKAEVARYRFEDDRKRAMIGRAMRRVVLAELTGRAPRELQFIRGEHGKPALDGGRIEFNVSHSGRLVALVVGPQPVGVDIEALQRRTDPLVSRYFSREEQEAVARATDTRAAFFTIWTAKEAVVKAVGCGLSRPLDSFTIRPDRDRFVAVDSDAAEMRSLVVRSLDLPDYAGAIATRGTPEGITMHPSPL